MFDFLNERNKTGSKLRIAVVRRSACCNAETYEAPAYYTNTMKTHKGEEIPKKIVCLKCGHECSERLF